MRVVIPERQKNFLQVCSVVFGAVICAVPSSRIPEPTMDTDTQDLTDESGLAISSADLDSIAEPSRPFVGNWQTLISQTNWEKGKIIFGWRTALQDQGLPNRLYSDAAWSRLVGEVSPQHVGRLRRTWERFGDVCQDYDGLYWSHFWAALEWQDAEMWLEGAVQNRWSVSDMRYQRWETMGQLAGERPGPEELVSGSAEEGVRLAESGTATGPAVREDTVFRDEGSAIQGPLREGPDFGDDEGAEQAAAARGSAASDSLVDRVDMDAILADLPDEIVLPFRDLRAAIVAARDDDWRTVKRIDVIALVNDLRMLLRKPPRPVVEAETS
jgi:hypothetical protein